MPPLRNVLFIPQRPENTKKTTNQNRKTTSKKHSPNTLKRIMKNPQRRNDKNMAKKLLGPTKPQKPPNPQKNLQCLLFVY